MLIASPQNGVPDYPFRHLRYFRRRSRERGALYLLFSQKEAHLRQYIAHAEDTMEMISEVTVPGAFLCDLWPWSELQSPLFKFGG